MPSTPARQLHSAKGRYGAVIILAAFSIVRSLWLYLTYSIGNDQGMQMNVSLNLLDGRGIVYGTIPGDASAYSPFNWFPPGISFLMAFFHHFVGNIFMSEYLIKCLIAVAEGVLAYSIVRKYVDAMSGRALVMILFAFYTGHVDRSGVCDMFCSLAALWLMWVVYRRLSTGTPMDRSTLAVMSILLPSMTLMKYNAFPIAMVPFCIFLCVGLFTRQWQLQRREWAGLAISVILASSSLYWSLGISKNAMMPEHQDLASEGNAFPQRLNDLLRIDPFWLHFGRRVEVVFKVFYSRLHGADTALIESYHFLQAASLLIFLGVLFAIVRKAGFNRILAGVLFFFTSAHVAFISMMHLVKGNGFSKVGVDGMSWSFMEETRLFSHLTFAFALLILLGTWRHARPLYWLLSAAFAYNTARTMYLSRSDMPYLSETYAKMRSGVHPDPEGEAARNRRAYYVWNYVLGHITDPHPGASKGEAPPPSTKPSRRP